MNQNEIKALEALLNQIKKSESENKKQQNPTIGIDCNDLDAEVLKRHKDLIESEKLAIKDKKMTQTDRLNDWVNRLFEGKAFLKYLIHLDYPFFNKNKVSLTQASDDYYNFKAKPPKYRINFFFCGKGGSGKSTLAHLMPAALKSDSFTCVDLEAGLTSYYGQNTIIWDELRSLGVLDWSPSRFLTITNTGKHNKGAIKVLYSYKQPLNHYNIITTSESHKSFFNRICFGNDDHSENTDQISRRFPYVFEFSKSYNFQKNHWITKIDLLVHDQIKVEQENIDSLDGYMKKIQFNFQTTEENFEFKLNELAKLLANAIDETHRINLTKIKNDFKQHFQNDDEDHLIEFD